MTKITLDEANRRAIRAFTYAAVAFGGLGFGLGLMVGLLI